MPRTVGSVLVFLVLILLTFVPMVIHFQGCKSEQVEGLNVYLGVLSNHGKIFLEVIFFGTLNLHVSHNS